MSNRDRYWTSRFFVVEILSLVSNADFVRVKVSVSLEETTVYTLLVNTMLTWPRAIRLARIVHACGILLERLWDSDFRFDNGLPRRVPGWADATKGRQTDRLAASLK